MDIGSSPHRIPLLAAGLLALAAAGPARADPVAAPPRPGGTVVLSAITEPATLHPLLAQDSVGTHICNLLFASLVRVNERFEPVPFLAETWQVSPDGRVWTFSLRRGVRFHDGVELTSRDVLFTYRAVRDPALDSPAEPHYRVVDRLEAPDRYTFRVVLKEPYAPLLFLMDLEIVPAHLFEGGGTSAAAFGRRPVGTGPFRFSRWEGGTVALEANPDFFAGRPFLDRVEFRTFPSRLSAWAALMRGEVDAVEDLDFQDYLVIRDDPRFQVMEQNDGFYYTLLFNLEDPLFRDPRMRRALSLAVDRADLIEQALDGWGVPAGGPFRPGTWAHDDGTEPDPCRPEEAAGLLAELGWHDADGDRLLEKGGRELAFTLLVDRGDSLKEKAARRLRWQLYQAGVRVEVEVMDLKALFAERLFPGTFQATLLQFNGNRDPDFYTPHFWQSEGAGKTNLARYRSAAADGLFLEGRRTFDFEARKEVYRRLHRLLAADRPALFLFWRKRFLGLSARVGGVRAGQEALYRSIAEWYIR